MLFRSGDVLYGKLRPYLMNWLYPQFKGIAVGDFWVLRPTDTDGSFLYRFIQSEHFQYNANISSGSKMPRADWSFVSEDNYFVPSNRGEQRLIGATFQQLDNLITLHLREPPVWLTLYKLHKASKRAHHQVNIFVFQLLDDMQIRFLSGVHTCMP